MAEQTFRSPDFYDREIDKSAPASSGPDGTTPAGVIGTANKGPAFVPVTVGSFGDFKKVFGDLDPKKYGPYAANQYLQHRGALTYLRVLGAGANASVSDIETTKEYGIVKNAGFSLTPVTASGDGLGRFCGATQFITARHLLRSDEAVGMPMFTQNDSYSGNHVNLVRGMLMLTSGTRALIYDGDALPDSMIAAKNDVANVVAGKFVLVLSATQPIFNSNAIKVYTLSLDPTDGDYFAKVLNSDPEKFSTTQHLLYADFAVDDELATAEVVGMVSGSNLTDPRGRPWRETYGTLAARYQTPSTPWFISQPFGATEYDLFKFEALDDGEYANTLYKVSIVGLKASMDEAKPYGSFNVQIRAWDDNDLNPKVLETFNNVSLDPNSDRYVAKVIGDRKVYFDFDATDQAERRLVTRGRYLNQSSYVRVVVSDQLNRGLVPIKALPFGFRGIEALKTNDSLTDTAGVNPRVVGVLGNSVASALSGSVLPPIPFRFKVTKGEIPAAASWDGQPGPTELAIPSLYWGVKFERNNLPLNANIAAEPNPLVASYTKFLGVAGLDTLVTGSSADVFNNNKFSLSKVALSNTSFNDLTASVNTHMREAAYVRDARVDGTDYTISDSLGRRLTLASVLASSGSTQFNRFAPFAKFTTFMYGGFDGVNILDPDAKRLNDKSTSFDLGGGAYTNYLPTGLARNPAGVGQSNNGVASYAAAVDVMTDPMAVTHNLLIVPGIRESYLTDYAADKVKSYGMAMYVMDIPSYDDNELRLFDDSASRPDVDQTSLAFNVRAIDNSCAATYFPDVMIDDTSNKRRVKVPASIAAVGALSFNDKIAYPWFAPAGFNRASLDFVKNVAVRLDINDRNRLQDSRINPIATFPREGWVIYGQKTLQVKKSALDRVNVRRLLLEVKRVISGIAKNLVFEQNTPSARADFTAKVMQQLGLIYVQSGVESFQVIMNETNNSQADIDSNKMNGKVVVVPTRTIEFIAVDFVITRSGVQFI